MKRPSWKGKTVLITSGPTREHLDPIRFLTNASSGKMGWALAAEARRRGARTIVISGPCALTPLAGVKTVAVVTGLQMLRETLARCAAADVVIAAAAVSDWRFAEVRSRKLKRGKDALRLTLKPNPDIIKAVSRRRKALTPGAGGIRLRPTGSSRSPRPSSPPKGWTSSSPTGRPLCRRGHA